MRSCEVTDCPRPRAPEPDASSRTRQSKYCYQHRREANRWLAEEARLDNEAEARRQYTLEWMHGCDRPSWQEEFGWDDPDELAEDEDGWDDSVAIADDEEVA